jgi:hypothetical protein
MGTQSESVAKADVAAEAHVPTLAAAAPLTPIATRILGLQRTAGNRAVGRMLARQPLPAVGADPRPEAAPLRDQLIAQQRGLEFSRGEWITDRDRLEEEAAANKRAKVPNPATEEAARTLFSGQVDRHNAALLQIKKDLDLLNSPTATPQQLNDLVARRGLKVAVDEERFQTGSQVPGREGAGTSRWQLGAGGVTKTGSTGTTRVLIDADGEPRSVTTERITTRTFGAFSADFVDTKKTTNVKGDKSWSTDVTDKTAVNWLDPGITRSRETKRTGADGKVETDKREGTIGISGVQGSRTTGTTDAGKTNQTTVSGGFKRGDNQATLGGGYSNKSGKVDDEGNLTQGFTKKASGSGGVYTDKDKGVGVGGDAGLGTDYVNKKPTNAEGAKAGETGTRSVTAGASIGGGGRFFTNVRKIEGKDEFLIITTILLSGTVALTGGAEQESANKDKAGVTGSYSYSRTDTITFTRKLPTAEAKKYLDDLNARGGSGTFKEHDVLRTGFENGWTKAKDAYMTMRGNPAGLARDLKEGESIDDTLETSHTLGGGASGGSGETGLGVIYSRAWKGRVGARIEGVNAAGNTVVAITVIEGEAETKGASVTQGPAGGGASWDEAKHGGKTYRFEVKREGNPSCDAQINELVKINTIEGLEAARKRYPGMFAGSVELAGDASGEKVTVTLGKGPLSLTGTLGGTGTFDKAIERDKDDNIIKGTYTGTSSSGGTIGIGSLKPGATRDEKYTGVVEEVEDPYAEDAPFGPPAPGEDPKKYQQKKAQVLTGKGTRSDTTTSVDKTIEAGKRAWKDPGRLVTDGLGSVLASETTAEAATMYGQGQYDAIVAEALDAATWNRHRVDHLRGEWIRYGAALRAAVDRSKSTDGKLVYDGHKVQEATARWNEQKVGGAQDTLEHVTAPIGGAGAGLDKVVFPAGMESLEPEYVAVVVKDPVRFLPSLAAADKALAAGSTDMPDKYKAAIGELNGIHKRLKALQAEIFNKADKFADKPGVQSSMLARITNRLKQVVNEIAAAQEHIAGGSTIPAEPPPPGTKATPQEQKERDAADAANAAAEQARIQRERPAKQTEFNDHFLVMSSYRQEIPSELDEVRKLYDGGSGLTANVQAINRVLDTVRRKLDDWDTRQAACRDLGSRYGFDTGPLQSVNPITSRSAYQDLYRETHKGY